MTKHTMVTFQLHRKGVILIVIGCVLLAVLLVAVGYLAGVARGRSAMKPAAAVPAAVAAKPKPAAAPAGAAAPAAPQEAFALRVGLVTSEAEAKDEVARLAIKKLTATVIPVERNESEIVYEIHVGRYPDRRAAVEAARSLRERGIDSAVVAAP